MERVRVRRGGVMGAALALVAGAGAAAFVALAQPGDKAPEKQAEKAGGDLGQGETPDGTKLPILKRAEIPVDLKIVIEELKIGTGAEAKADSTITFHYRVSLASDGKLVQTSAGKEPITYPLSRLIPGWQRAIPGMKVGGVRMMHVPYLLAYGDRGSPPDIPGKADLIFSIELVAVKDEAPAAGK